MEITTNAHGDNAFLLSLKNGWQINVIALKCGHSSYLAIPTAFSQDKVLFAAYLDTLSTNPGSEKKPHVTDDELAFFIAEVARRKPPALTMGDLLLRQEPKKEEAPKKPHELN
jgi:hypothetical protein